MKIRLNLLALLMTSSSLYADNLDFSAEEQAAWEAHKESITEPAEYLGADALAGIEADYKVDPYDEERLRDLCHRMERHKYVHNYILESAADRLQYKRLIESQYWDSISAILIPSNPGMAGRYLGYAVMMKEQLAITEEGIRILTDRAIEYAGLLRKTPCATFAQEELTLLHSLFDRQQIEKIIDRRNETTIASRTQRLWQALEKAGLTAELDEAEDRERASMYYRKEQFIRDYFAGDRSLMDANLIDLNRNKPRVIRMYEGVLQKEAVRKRHEERVGKEFSW